MACTSSMECRPQAADLADCDSCDLYNPTADHENFSLATSQPRKNADKPLRKSQPISRVAVMMISLPV